MDCFLLLVRENVYNKQSSEQVLLDLFNTLFPDESKAKDEIGLVYEETNTFPKKYFFNTTNRQYISRLKEKHTVIEGDFPISFPNKDSYRYLGNYSLMPFSCNPHQGTSDHLHG